MLGRFSPMDVEAAREDLKNRTLAKISLEFARLIYLASTRDYNTGRYYHDGLAFRFSEALAAQALSDAHKEAFEDLALSPLEHLVDELHSYLRSVGAQSSEVIQVWEKLEPYRVAVPCESDPLTKRYFLGNVKIALAIVESRERATR
ncbi:MAG: hypothetical protein DMG78_29375 [Acidobacteria bacterium]|nr:MAG: hypothetical protein DMG78_29375 [Acidobacteriota bacterium]